MLSLSQLLVLTAQDRKRFKTDYTIESLRKEKDEDTIGEFLSYISMITGGKESRVASVVIYAPAPAPDALARVSCTCPYFKLKLASSLYRAGSAKERPPPETREEVRKIQRPGLCPHLFYLIETLLSERPPTKEPKRTKRQVSARLKGLT